MGVWKGLVSQVHIRKVMCDEYSACLRDEAVSGSGSGGDLEITSNISSSLVQNH